MRVYKHTWSGGRKSRKYYVEYRDYTGKIRRKVGYTDRRATEQLGAELERRAARIAVGLDEPSRDGKSALSEFISEWERAMVAKGSSPQHSHGYSRVVREVIHGCDFATLRDLDGHQAQVYLESRLHAVPEQGRKLWTNRTYCWARSALLAFGYWISDKRKLLPSNPFTCIDSRNPEIGKARTRRALTDAEFRKLLKAAKSGEHCFGLSGEQRHFLYLVASRTGLRLSACCALTPAHFNLNREPCVHSSIRMQKNRRAHTIPLSRSVADALRKWFAGKSSHELLWPIAASNRAGSKMVRRDLEAAGVPYRTDEGTADFHSLRHLFAVNLVRAGASVVETQQLLDHCSPVLTSRYYKHLQTEQLRKPVERLPKL